MQKNANQSDERFIHVISILKYALDRSTSVKYACNIYGKSEDYVRKFKSRCNNQNQIDQINDLLSRIKSKDSNQLSSYKFSQTNEKSAVLDAKGNLHVKTLEDLLTEADVDQEIWTVDKHDINKWDVTNSEGKTYQNWQVKAYLKRKRTETEQTEWKDFLNTLSGYSPTVAKFKKKNQAGKYMLEISIPDLHVGKHAHKAECGENYDTKEAIYRADAAFDSFIEEIWYRKDDIGQILIPIGNDLINIDNERNETTSGTPQSVDSRWQKMFLKTQELFIRNIDKCTKIAPVKIVIVSGNHDKQTMFYLGEALKAWYRNDENVEIDNSETQRKYVEFGSNMILFTHGNEEKHQDLLGIAATEEPELWARTKFREAHLGHFHKRKETNYVWIDENRGFRIKILPSLSGSDPWHKSKGYESQKSAMAFLYHIEDGPKAEYIFNLI